MEALQISLPARVRFLIYFLNLLLLAGLFHLGMGTQKFVWGATAIENCFRYEFVGLTLSDQDERFGGDFLKTRFIARDRARDDDTRERIDCPEVSLIGILLPAIGRVKSKATQEANPDLDLTFTEDSALIRFSKGMVGRSIPLKVIYEGGGKEADYLPGGSVTITTVSGEEVVRTSAYLNDTIFDASGEYNLRQDFVKGRPDWLSATISGSRSASGTARLIFTVSNNLLVTGVVPDGAEDVQLIPGDLNTQVKFTYELKAGEIRHPMVDVLPVELGPVKVKAVWAAPGAFDPTFREREVFNRKEFGIIEAGSADLKAQLSMDSDLRVGQESRVSLSVTNVGDGPSPVGATVQVRLSSGLKVNGATDDEPSFPTGNGSAVEFTVDSIEVGKSRDLYVIVEPERDSEGSYRIVSVIEDGQSSTQNNRERIDGTVNPPENTLTLSVSDLPEEIEAGKSYTSRISVQNDSDNPASNFVVVLDFAPLLGVGGLAVDFERTESTPANLQTSTDESALTGTLDRLEPGARADISVTYRVTPQEFIREPVSGTIVTTVSADGTADLRDVRESSFRLTRDPPPATIESAPAEIVADGEGNDYTVRFDNSNGERSSGTFTAVVEPQEAALAIPQYLSARDTSGRPLLNCRASDDGRVFRYDCPLTIEQQELEAITVVISVTQEEVRESSMQVTVGYTDEEGNTVNTTTTTRVTPPEEEEDIRISYDPSSNPQAVSSGKPATLTFTADTVREEEVDYSITISSAHTDLTYEDVRVSDVRVNDASVAYVVESGENTVTASTSDRVSLRSGANAIEVDVTVTAPSTRGFDDSFWAGISGALISKAGAITTAGALIAIVDDDDDEPFPTPPVVPLCLDLENKLDCTLDTLCCTYEPGCFQDPVCQ